MINKVSDIGRTRRKEIIIILEVCAYLATTSDSENLGDLRGKCDFCAAERPSEIVVARSGKEP